jgi:hypothetical protein
MDAQISGPQLESAPQYDRAQYFAEKQHLLESYGWIDARRGVARIPIDVAIQILAQSHEAKSSANPAAPLKGKDRAAQASGQAGISQ